MSQPLFNSYFTGAISRIRTHPCKIILNELPFMVLDLHMLVCF